MGTHMKTTVEIADPLAQEARELAQRQGRTFRDLVETGLRKVIAEERAETKPFRARDASVGGQGLREGLSYDDWETILEMGRERPFKWR